jgi:DNA-binding transcriptional ArsR family regulator
MKIEEAVAAGVKPDKDVRIEIRKLLAKSPMNEGELADALDVSPKRIRQALSELRAGGANMSRLSEKRLLLHNIVEHGGRLVLKAKDRGDGWMVFGFITDNHKANKHHRQDVEDAAYEAFAKEGVTDVLNAGNWIDGEARFNKSELTVFGMDGQIDNWIDTTPVHQGITTHFISGDDHEGWYAQRECINIGQYAEMRAEKAGRKDLRYLGHVEADIELKCGKGSAVMRMMHPGGGSAYAFSYAPQKIVESFQGGEKPAVLLIGHYHKWDNCYPREVHVISGGCAEDQTMFMRKKKLAAHVGFVIVGIKQDSTDGHVTRVRAEWVPFYDRGYFERRFG